MKFIFNKGLLIVLISLFSFISCKKEGDLGLEQQINEEGLLGTKVDSCSIVAFSVRDDSLISANYVRNQLGEFQDPQVGTTNASIAFQALLSQNNVDFGTSPTIDSVVLVLGYINEKSQRFYGDSASTMNIEVFQLDEDISNDSVYFSNKSFRTKPTAIGSRSYQPKPDDSLTIQNIRDGKSDTVVKVYPQLRIRLNDSFGQELLSKSGQVDLSDNAAFLSAYKGFNVKATRTSGAGGVMSFDLGNSNRSYLVLYYKQGTDTTNFVFNINSPAANVNKYEHTYTGTEVEQQLSDSSLGNQKVFIQSLGGLRAKLRFPTVAKLLDSGLIAINKAELVVKVLPGSETPYEPIQNMAFKIIDTDGKTLLISTALYSSTKKQYTLEFTRALQEIIQGKILVREYILEDNSKQIRANRTIISGFNAVDPIQLRIFYTKLY
jgi:hypothetical protein